MILQLLHTCGECRDRPAQTHRRLVCHVPSEKTDERTVDTRMAAESILEIRLHTSVGLQGDPTKPGGCSQWIGYVGRDCFAPKFGDVIANLDHLVRQQQQDVLRKEVERCEHRILFIQVGDK